MVNFREHTARLGCLALGIALVYIAYIVWNKKKKKEE